MRLVHRAACIAVSCVVLAACASTEEVALPPPPAPGEPMGYIGLSAGKLRTAFGAPAFVRKDGTGEIWRYDAASCRAFFFFYPDDSGFEVRHVETLPHSGVRAADATCLDALRARSSPPVS